MCGFSGDRRGTKRDRDNTLVDQNAKLMVIVGCVIIQTERAREYAAPRVGGCRFDSYKYLINLYIVGHVDIVVADAAGALWQHNAIGRLISFGQRGVHRTGIIFMNWLNGRQLIFHFRCWHTVGYLRRILTDWMNCCP